MEKPFTLLIHGLHMHGLYMRPLAKKLAQAGFSTHAPSYHSLTQSIEAHSQIIHHWLLEHHQPDLPLNFVGHSLGGLVIRHFLATYGSRWQTHRCVTLGTPHQGSICASYANKLLPALVRRAYPNALDGSCPHLDDEIEFGVIAGTRPLGLGRPILSYHSRRHQLDNEARIHDGTVYLSETPLSYAKDYLILPVSHSELLTDAHTAQQIIHFLEHGQFATHKKPPQ